MRTIVGIALLVFGMASALVANLLHYQAEADLLDKHPEWSSRIPVWWSMKQLSELRRLYKCAFPEGRKIKQFWLWTIFAFAGSLLGWFLLIKLV